jgi:co-chaperonin GroES (HSP10)
MLKLQAINDRVTVLLDSEYYESEDTTSSSLYIPVDEKATTIQGTVQSIGSNKDIAVKVGDKVLFNKYSATFLKGPHKGIVSLKQDEILCVIK